MQNSVINTIPDIFSVTEETLLKTIAETVTKHSNPTVHRMHFGSLAQSTEETIKEFLIRLKSSAKDCEFTCQSCNADLQPTNIRDQFIRGLYNDTLQTDILAKASHLSLEDIVKHSEAFKTAMRDQQKLQLSDLHAFRSSTCKKNHASSSNDPPAPPPSSGNKKHPCSGCGSLSHGQKGAKDRPTHCPAWGTTCHNCQIPNHFSRVCLRGKDHVGGLIAKLSTNANVEQIDVKISPCLERHRQTCPQPVTVNVFPDSGASICLAGLQHLSTMGLSADALLPCTKTVTVVGGSKIYCTGWLPIIFSIGKLSTKQPLYNSEKADRIYLSRQGCTALQILPSSFPYPMPEHQVNLIEATPSETPRKIPPKPEQIPYPPLKENTEKLKQYLIDSFKDTLFNKSIPFPAMETKPVHIYLKPDAVPHAQQVPIPVPFHWKDQVKKDLDADVEREIIKPVPIGNPVQWCSKMIVTAKKNGKPHRVVDLQKLNSQCLRETHHCPSPFQAACQVPAHSKKTVFDAVDGYHSIKLDKESQPLTTFITEWGRYLNLRLPQAFLAAGDAYTRRFDELISKFQFCQDVVTFAGLKLTPTAVSPTDKMLSAIRDFPSPTNITDA